MTNEERATRKQHKLEICTVLRDRARGFIDASERDTLRDLQRQLQLLRSGQLFLAPGDVAEPLTSLDAQVADFTTRRDRAQAAHDGCVEQAEALLGEAVLQ